MKLWKSFHSPGPFEPVMTQDSLSPPVCRTAPAVRYTARMTSTSSTDVEADPGAGRVRALALCAVVAALMGAGCQKALFSPEDERSPYDRYDAIRAQRAPPSIENEYGQKKPNLRGRLLDND